MPKRLIFIRRGQKVLIKHASGVLLSIILLISLIAVPSFILTITSHTASANPSTENFTIVVLPDTQYYSQDYPGIFENQTEWIVQNKSELNIVFVAHLGDIVNDHGAGYQWQSANAAMSILDNKVPYGLLPGNHDMAGNINAPEYESYFPASRYEGYSYWGGSYDPSAGSSSSPNMNNYQLFSASGMDFIALNLQYNPPADVLSWADNVLSTYPNRRAIISTHAYIQSSGEWVVGGPIIWREAVVPHNNVFLVLCGHELGQAEKIDNLDNKRTVYQLLSDYQGFAEGGDGYLRIMKFAPSQNTIHVTTYSPYLNKYLVGPSSQFEMFYPMNSTTGGGISLMVYVGAIVVIVVIIAALLIIKKPF